jgi:hypothetical protein
LIAFSFRTIESDPQGHLLPSGVSDELNDTALAKAVNVRSGVHWNRSAGRSVHNGVDTDGFRRHVPLKTDARRSARLPEPVILYYFMGWLARCRAVALFPTPTAPPPVAPSPPPPCTSAAVIAAS